MSDYAELLRARSEIRELSRNVRSMRSEMERQRRCQCGPELGIFSILGDAVRSREMKELRRRVKIALKADAERSK